MTVLHDIVSFSQQIYQPIFSRVLVGIGFANKVESELNPAFCECHTDVYYHICNTHSSVDVLVWRSVWVAMTKYGISMGQHICDGCYNAGGTTDCVTARSKPA